MDGPIQQCLDFSFKDFGFSFLVIWSMSQILLAILECVAIFFFDYCFIHPIFRLWFVVTFGNLVMKIRKYYIILVYVLQGKRGKTKNGMKITQIKLPEYQKPIDENMG
jgi:hypothetical protein